MWVRVCSPASYKYSHMRSLNKTETANFVLLCFFVTKVSLSDLICKEGGYNAKLLKIDYNYGLRKAVRRENLKSIFPLESSPF